MIATAKAFPLGYAPALGGAEQLVVDELMGARSTWRPRS
jgi:hypothetical protein